ncbi:hypothetical protein Nepgr_010238 [Nepenthes gracilis]|uniref:Uncharacterized protein n=1 Tax=Nepenthes gracilis TaxID=150966 RepID=A0AAD3XKV1_NEPGR|nr:hypothetical protein Nepgr_010238 [Nepenthes gracilis]
MLRGNLEHPPCSRPQAEPHSRSLGFYGICHLPIYLTSRQCRSVALVPFVTPDLDQGLSQLTGEVTRLAGGDLRRSSRRTTATRRLRGHATSSEEASLLEARYLIPSKRNLQLGDGRGPREGYTYLAGDLVLYDIHLCRHRSVPPRFYWMPDLA